MAFKYNPLLKIGLDNTGNGSGGNSQKVTKFFAATDNLEDGEIAQFQGEDDLSNNLKRGYFYQKTGSTQELPAGTQFFNNIATTVNLYGYNVKPGNFYVKEIKTPTTDSNFFNYNLYRFENFWNYQFLTLNDARPDVGDVLFNTNNNTIVTVSQVTFDSQFRTNYILSDGTTIVLTARTGHALNALYTFIDNDLNLYTIADCRELNSWVLLHYSLSDNTFNIIDWFTIPYELLQTTSDPVIIGNNVFQQTDTQPQPGAASTSAAGLMSAADKTKLDGIAQNANNYSLPTAAANVLGGVKVGSNLAIDENGVLSGNYRNATSAVAGLMSDSDKNRLDQTLRYFYTAYSNTSINTVINSIIRSNGIVNECGVACFGSNIADAPIGTNSFVVQWYRAGNLSLRVFLICFSYTNEIYFGFFETGSTPTEITWKQII